MFVSVSCEIAQSVGAATAVYSNGGVSSEMLTFVSHSAWFVAAAAICSSLSWDGGIAAILLSCAGNNCGPVTANRIDRNEGKGF